MAEMAISGMGGYSGGGGGSNGMQQQLMRNESSSDSLAAMLGPGLQGVEMQAGQKRTFFAAFDGPTVEDGPEDGDDGGDDGFSPGGVEKKRRLTFDQVRSLERNFEIENKLEPERKMQLAKELGLRPRQVAVWFQNRRARWKTKQLERDYESLAADYERLKADYEQVVGEKNRLKAEVQRLSGSTTDGITPAPESAPDFVSRLHNSRSSPTVDVSLAYKEETSGCSNSSDVLDADSPRTTDSSSPASERAIEFSLPESSFMAPPPGMLQDVVKLEDGEFHEADQSCNYLLLQLDEQSVLPWWDWP